MAEGLEIAFGQSGNSAGHLRAGWSTHEPDGVWTVDGESTLVVPRPERPGDYLLELELGSLRVPQRAFQRLSVRVNGAVVGTQVLRGDALVQCWVPWPALRDAPECVIALSHPDGWSPSEAGGPDPRVLSLHVRTLRLSLLTEQASATVPGTPDEGAPDEGAQDEGARDHDAQDGGAQEGGAQEGGASAAGEDGAAMHALVLDFESLGPGSALGLVQRHHGAEPLGLFRLGRTPLDGLIRVLEDDLDAEGFAERASLVLDPETRAYVLVDGAHGFEWHTGLREGQVEAGALERQARARLPWLARRFHEVLEDASRLLVLCDEATPADAAQVGRLLGLLRRRGDVTLLWVGAAGDGHAAGEVGWAGDALLRGWTDGSMAGWGELCRRAHRLWRTARAA